MLRPRGTAAVVVLIAAVVAAPAPVAAVTDLTWPFTASDGWTCANANCSIVSGAFHIVPTTADPQALSPTISFSPSAHDYMRAILRRSPSGANGEFQIYYRNGAHDFMEPFSKIYNITADGALHQYTIPLSGDYPGNAQLAGVSGWANSTITRLRLDPTRAATGSADYDLIAVRRDDSPPLTPVIDNVSTSCSNGAVTISVHGDDPPPFGFSGATDPDRYGSGVFDFGWTVDGGTETWTVGSVPDQSAGTSFLDLVFPAGSLTGGTHKVLIRSRDRCGQTSASVLTTISVSCAATWLFGSDFEGWSPVNASLSLVSGFMRVHPTNATNDPYVISPALQIVPTAHDYLRVGVRSSSSSNEFQIYYESCLHPNFSENFTKIYRIATDGIEHYYTIPLSGTYPGNSQLQGIPDWASGSTVSRLRLDPARSSTGDVDFDFIALRRDDQPPTPPVVDGMSPPGYTNGNVTVTLHGDDPPPACVNNTSVNPDFFGSGVFDFGWQVDNGPITWQVNGGFDTIHGTATVTLSVPTAGVSAGPHTLNLYSRDRTGWVSAPTARALLVALPNVTGLQPSSTQAALPQTFGWNGTPGYSQYLVQISSDAAFPAGATSQLLTNVPWLMIPAVAAPVSGQTYFWRVETVSPFGDNWSAATQFTPYVPPPPPASQVIGQEFPSGELGEGVNTSLGAVTRSFTVLTLRGPGGDFPLNAWYSSISQRNSLIGSRWNWTLGQLLTPQGGGATVTLEDNQDLGFTGSGGAFTPALGIYDSLATTGGGFDCVRPSRLKLSFDPLGTLQQLTDRNDNVVVLHYSGGVLTSFDDPAGRNYSVTIAGSRITQIQEAFGLHRTWSFAYDGNFLHSFTDAKGAITTFEYDTDGRLLHVLDPRNNDAVRYTYDANGRVQTQADAFSQITTFAYDDSSTTVTNPLGGSVRHVRDVNARLIADIDELGNRTSYAYDANHNRISATDPLGHTTNYAYDPRGNLYQVVDALNDTTLTVFDYSNQPVFRTEPLGRMTSWVNDARGNPTEIDEPQGKVTRYSFNAAGQVTSMLDANNNPTTYSYDAQGNRTSMTDAENGVTLYGYDPAGRRTSITEPLSSFSTTFAYDLDDSLTSRADPLGNATSYEYDPNGNRTVVLDPRHGRAEYTFDAKNRLTQLKDAREAITQLGYDFIDRKVSTTDPRGGVTTFEYDAASNLLKETDALSHDTRHTYDAARNRLTTTDSRGKTTTYTYDALNRLSTTEDPLGNRTTNTYDDLGRLVGVTNPRHQTRGYDYDLLGRLTSVRAPSGALLQYGYDPVGNRTSVTNARQHTSSMTYDRANRLLTAADPLGNTHHYAYDAAGHQIQRTDARGRITFYTYDAADRLVKTTYDDSSKIVRDYDANGNLTNLTDQWGFDTYTYDALNHVINSTDHFGQSLAFAYDSTGNMTALTYPGGQVCHYVFDAANRLTTLTDWNSRSIAYAYDAAGNNTGITYPNGVTTTQTFDDTGRPVSILTKTPAQDTLVSFAYELDENGNRTKIVRVDRRQDPIRGGGADVYATSAALSGAAFPTGADSVVLASGEAWEEGVAAAGVARVRGIPALVVPGDNLWASSATQAELAQLKGVRPTLGSIVMGDIGSISAVVEAQLGSQGMPARRVHGADRYGTAAAAAGPSGTVVLLGGSDPSRAGAAALVGARWNATVLLTKRDSLPATVQTTLASLSASRAILVGDEATIGTPVASWLTGHGYKVLKRYASADPAAISAQALEDTLTGTDRYGAFRLASKNAFPDALSAAADPLNASMPTLLCSQDSLASSPDVVRWIGRHKGRVHDAFLLGPTGALSSNVEAELRTFLRTTTTTYAYNSLDELTSEIIPGVDTTTYVYDAMGNRASLAHNGVQTTYVYDGADRLTGVGAATLSYDANGNRIGKSGGGPSSTYAYDFENRLTQVVGTEGTSGYRYDGLGRRIRTQEPTRTIRYVLDPTSKPYRTLGEMDDAGATLVSYTHGAGLASEVRLTGSTRYYHFDALGSTAAVTDISGADVGHIGYTAFGDTAIALGSTATNFGYVGRYGVEATASGLQFMRDRFYDPFAGLFLSTDPVGGAAPAFLDGVSYLYASADPINAIDPSGQSSSKKKTAKGFNLSSVFRPVTATGNFILNNGARHITSNVVADAIGKGPRNTIDEFATRQSTKIVGKAAVGAGVGAAMQIYGDVRSGVNSNYIPLRATLAAEESAILDWTGVGWWGGMAAGVAIDTFNEYVGFRATDWLTDKVIVPTARTFVNPILDPLVQKYHWY